jgi:hypothetical protein
MRKQIIEQAFQAEVSHTGDWINAAELAQVELSSEAQGYPIEAALSGRAESGWRAGTPGPQVIRLRFDNPFTLSGIYLLFEELEQARTQEFVLSWLSEEEHFYKQIVRQQYTFSPPGTTRQVEAYQVDLRGVQVLELKIVPDITNAVAYASLLQLRLR